MRGPALECSRPRTSACRRSSDGVERCCSGGRRLQHHRACCACRHCLRTHCLHLRCPSQPRMRVTAAAALSATAPSGCKRPTDVERTLQRLRPASSPAGPVLGNVNVCAGDPLTAIPTGRHETATATVDAPARRAHRPQTASCSCCPLEALLPGRVPTPQPILNLTGSTEPPKSQARSVCWASATAQRPSCGDAARRLPGSCTAARPACCHRSSSTSPSAAHAHCAASAPRRRPLHGRRSQPAALAVLRQLHAS